MKKTWLGGAAVALALGAAVAALAVALTREREQPAPRAAAAMPAAATARATDKSEPQKMSGMDMPGMDMGATEKQTPRAEQPPAVSSLPETPLLSPTRMGDLVMPPGMIVTKDTSMEAMRAMAAVDLTKISYTAPPTARGDQPLVPRIVGGVKVFNLQTSLIRWSILPDVQVAAYAYNQQVPGPRIRITQGNRVRIVVTNHLPEPTSVHWHGLVLPNAMDGAAGVTQQPIAPGKSFSYEFTAEQAGTFFYHSHQQADRQQSLGLYGALIVDPKQGRLALPGYDKEAVIQLQEWTVEEGYTFPAMLQNGLLPNFFTINGKAYPSTQPIEAKVGQKVLLRFIGSSSGLTHPMHIHGGPFTIVATDGSPVPPAARLTKDTIAVAPGERYDVIWTARRPGKWLVHCHVLHHTTNDDVEQAGGGGLTTVIDVT